MRAIKRWWNYWRWAGIVYTAVKVRLWWRRRRGIKPVIPEHPNCRCALIPLTDDPPFDPADLDVVIVQRPD